MQRRPTADRRIRIRPSLQPTTSRLRDAVNRRAGRRAVSGIPCSRSASACMATQRSAELWPPTSWGTHVGTAAGLRMNAGLRGPSCRSDRARDRSHGRRGQAKIRRRRHRRQGNRPPEDNGPGVQVHCSGGQFIGLIGDGSGGEEGHSVPGVNPAGCRVIVWNPSSVTRRGDQPTPMRVGSVLTAFLAAHHRTRTAHRLSNLSNCSHC